MSTRRERLTTIVLMGAAAVTEKMDEGVLPAVFLAVGQSLRATPAQLGAVALCRALAQAASSPLAGALGDSLDRTRVVSAGCLLWALATLLLAAATSLRQMVLLAAFNGLGLALALPALQSVVADAVPAKSRGAAFGGVGLAAGVGGMLAAFSATAAARRRFFGGVEGWRVAFVAVALISAAVGVLSWFFAVDPRDRRGGGGFRGGAMTEAAAAARRRRRRWRGKQQEKLSDPGELGGGGGSGGNRDAEGEGPLLPSTTTTSTTATTTTTSAPSHPSSASPPPPRSFPETSLRRYLSDALAALRAVSAIPSFRVVVGQGVLGSMPWNALVFATLWMQLLGFSDVSAGAIAALFAAAVACGNLLGGFLGDAAARRSRKSSSVGGVGRVAVAQFSVAASIPLAIVLLRVLPASGPCRCQENVGGVVVGKFLPRGAASSANAACSPRSEKCTAAFALVVALTGLFSSWCGANNSAVFAEIVPAELRSSVYAFDRSFEGAVGALATPLVGVVASRVFGFEGTLAGSSSSSSSSSASDPAAAAAALNLPQARALASALLVCSVVPWALCLAAYTLLYRFYPLDAAAAAASASEASIPTEAAAAAGRGGGGSERMAAAAAPAPEPSSLELVESSLFRGAANPPPPPPPPPHLAAAASTFSGSSGSLLERGENGASASAAAAARRDDGDDDEVASLSSAPMPAPSSSAGVFGRLLRRSLERGGQRRR